MVKDRKNSLALVSCAWSQTSWWPWTGFIKLLVSAWRGKQIDERLSWLIRVVQNTHCWDLSSGVSQLGQWTRYSYNIIVVFFSFMEWECNVFSLTASLSSVYGHSFLQQFSSGSRWDWFSVLQYQFHCILRKATWKFGTSVSLRICLL